MNTPETDGGDPRDWSDLENGFVIRDDALHEAVGGVRDGDDNYEVVKTPDEWSVEFDVLILDADGWREAGAPAFNAPISKGEFQRRLASCTQGPRSLAVEPVGQVPDPRTEAAAKAEYEYQRDVREMEWQRGKWETLADPVSRRRYIERAQRALAAADAVDPRDTEIQRLKDEADGWHRASVLAHAGESRAEVERDDAIADAEATRYAYRHMQADRDAAAAEAVRYREDRDGLQVENSELHDEVQRLRAEVETRCLACDPEDPS